MIHVLCRDLEVVETYSSVLKDDVILLPTANDLGAGFAYYLCEIVVPELEKCRDQPPSHDALVTILDPFVQGLVQTENKILLKKMREDIFDAIAEHVDTVPFTSLDIMAMAEDLFSLGMSILVFFVNLWRKLSAYESLLL